MASPLLIVVVDVGARPCVARPLNHDQMTLFTEY
jgi:hypothetical protein